MKRAKRSILATALATAMMLAGSLPGSALAAAEGITINERPQEVAMFFDGVIARPALVGMTVVGTGLFAMMLPFSALGGNTHESAEHLVLTPARAAFIRCLGCTPRQHDRLMGEKELERSRREAMQSSELTHAAQ